MERAPDDVQALDVQALDVQALVEDGGTSSFADLAERDARWRGILTP